MQFLREIQLSIKFYWRSLRFIDQNNLWHILIIPALLHLMLAICIAFLAWSTSDMFLDWFRSNFIIGESKTGIHALMEGVISLAIRGSVIFLYLKIFRYGVLILFAPMMTYLSGRIQTIDHSLQKPHGFKMYVTDCTRAIRIAMSNFLQEIVLTFFILVFSILITWLFPVAPLFILLVESYFFGYSMADLRNEFFNMSIDDSKSLISEHRGLVIGNGLFFNFLLLIPLIGVLFAPTFSLIASGLSFNYVEKRKNILCASDPSTLIMAKH